MANSTYTLTMPDLHSGPAYVWPVVLAPADGSRMLVDTNGNPQNPASSQWTASIKGNAISLGQQFWDGANIEVAVQAGTAGSGAEPTWSTSPYPVNSMSSATTADNTVKWVNLGTPYAAGSTEGEATVTFDTKTKDIEVDQETGIVDAIMTAQTATINVKLKESSLLKIWYSIPGGLYSSGTDTGLPAGAQTYEEFDFGGYELPNLLFPSVGFTAALISPRRGYSSPGKYNVATLYNCYPKSVLKWGATRSKETVYELTLQGMENVWRTRGKRIGQFFRQT